jgi:hypothetical protein
MPLPNRNPNLLWHRVDGVAKQSTQITQTDQRCSGQARDSDYKESDSRKAGSDYKPGSAGRRHLTGVNWRWTTWRWVDP